MFPTNLCLQTEVKDHEVSLGLTYGQLVDPPTIYSFLDQNYHYKWLAIQISHDAGLAPIQYTGQKFLSRQGSNQQDIW